MINEYCEPCESITENKKVLVPALAQRDIMKTLLNDLRLSERRELPKDILKYTVLATLQDVVFIFVTVSGKKDGMLLQDTYAHKVYGREMAGVERAAIQITTASAICAMLDLLKEGDLPQRGFVRQEQVSLDKFLANRFGKKLCLKLWVEA